MDYSEKAKAWMERYDVLRKFLDFPHMPEDVALYVIGCEDEKGRKLESLGVEVRKLGETGYVDTKAFLAAFRQLFEGERPAGEEAKTATAENWTRAETARYLRCSVDAVDRNPDLAKLRRQVGKRILFRRVDVLRYADRRK